MNDESERVVDAAVAALAAALAGRAEIAVAFLFGSASRGKAAGASDLDVAIVPSGELADSLAYRTSLAEELTRRCGVRVDVVLAREASPELAARIVREGRVLLSRDESARVRYETEALRRYFDTARLRHELDRALLADLREGRFLG